MKKCLAIYANPNPRSFTSQILGKFVDGMNSVGEYTIASVDVFQQFQTPDGDFPMWKAELDDIKQLILGADLIVFAFPLWWEMPPAALVEFLQTIFVKDFAYTHENGVKTNILDKRVINLISMGREQPFDTTNLSEAMKYCGLKPTHCIFTKVGPNLSEKLATEYLDWAYDIGKEA